jgi:hypothetical protein
MKSPHCRASVTRAILALLLWMAPRVRAEGDGEAPDLDCSPGLLLAWSQDASRLGEVVTLDAALNTLRSELAYLSADRIEALLREFELRWHNLVRNAGSDDVVRRLTLSCRSVSSAGVARYSLWGYVRVRESEVMEVMLTGHFSEYACGTQN